VETNPTEMTELTTDANKTYLLDEGIYVPLVKLVRRVAAGRWTRWAG